MTESKRKPVLLNVDDDEAGRYAVTRELRRADFDVIEAASGLAALESIRKNYPDLIVLDIRLPDINGFEVCRRVRENPETSALPILLLSASYLDSTSKVMGLDGGADAYLTEPVEPPVLVATIRSLLRLKRAERMVRDSARQWAATFNAIQDGVAVLDQNGATLQANEAFHRIVGSNGGALASVVSGLFGRLVSSDRPTAELEIESKVLTVTMDKVLSESGEISGSVCIVADITEKRRFEQQIQHTQKLESIGVLAGGIAHDFNNLLTGILGNASLLMNDLSQDSPERDLAAQILKASESAAMLTRQILAYSGKGRLVTELIDLSAIALECRSLVRPFIPNAVQLIYDLAPSLPPVEADPGQMQQIVMNLIINAAESFKGKPGAIRLKTASQQLERSFFQSADPEVEPGLFACITVSDNGSGMDPETQRKIFDPFFTTKFIGRGLGLSAVHGILRGHRGLLRLQSAPGAGTAFELFFPAALGREAAPQPGSPVRSPRGTGTILVIDDESVVLQFARNALAKYGYEVLTADNGKTGVEIFEQMAEKISLVLLDFSMPAMSGEETLQRLRRIAPSVRVVLTSGFHHDIALRGIDETRLAGFIGKPYTAAQLAEAIGSALQKSLLDPASLEDRNRVADDSAPLPDS